MSATTSTFGLPPLSPHGTARQRLADAGERLAPPMLTGELSAEEAFLAHEVAGWASELGPGERRRFEAIIAGLLVELGAGSTRRAISPDERALLARLPELAAPPGAAVPFIVGDDEDGGAWLAPHRLHAAEARLGVALAARLRGAADPRFTPDAVAAAVSAVASSAQPAPSASQQAAVTSALGGRLGVITGGPGTGKTTIVLTLVRALARLGVAPEAVALAAPTGKAANRLGEAMREGLARLTAPEAADRALIAAPPVPETLHRLLRHSPSARAFAHREGAPLPFEVVIVDESSMIDLSLMDRLVAALGPATLLVLLGDADQLPSVEAGAVFRDLAALGVRLSESHRMDPRRPEGRRILELATAVRAGERDVASRLDRRASAAELAFAGAELCPGGALAELCARWFDERIRALPALAKLGSEVFVLGPHAEVAGEGGFDGATASLFDEVFAHYQRFRLLGVTRARPTGVDALNAFMHARFAGRPGLVPGEPVMMLRNDYERGLWNGDQGLVVTVAQAGDGRARGRLCAVFKVAGRWRAFPLDGLREALVLAFAMTVHKAQGSEYDDVALVLPEAPHPLLTRDLVYTALTRCRRALILCGDDDVLTAGVASAIRRSSGLAVALTR